MNDPVIFSYGLNGAAAGQALQGKRIGEVLKSDDLAWVHLDATHHNAADWLHENLSYLDPFVVQALVAEETRPRTTITGKGALVIYRGVNMNENSSPEDMISVRLWIDEHRIISLQRRPSRSIASLASDIGAGKGPDNAGAFAAAITARLTAYLGPVVSEIDDTVDDLEEQLIEGVDQSERHAINAARRKTLVLRRFLAPQKDAILQFRDADLAWLSDGDRRHLGESYHIAQRNVEDLDMIRERAQIVKEELANGLADKMNRNMYILSVIAAIFLPLGFLTGLLGINIGGIPGADNPNAFWWFALGMVIIVAAQVWLFRKMRWF
ncbi:dihydroorotate dehydrogenase [Amylibacter kogurei]|uniref:Dihydroorotate dehydrogenase n=1 Tax=Paramylibacter kogurei TaxID=1889778 RepID=A0A2G5K190_9RHOB|nr:zinc transporter ZntB [Amylibacter kogurei]PIB23281.1 dihydroorotate dehydrogenase [Amylibacter kogurei]